MKNTLKGYHRKSPPMWPSFRSSTRFQMREMTPADAGVCAGILRSEGVDPAALPGKAFVLRVLSSGASIAVMFERPRQPPRPSQPMGFGVTAFVQPACSDWARALAQQSRTQDLVVELEARADIHLSREAVAQANAGDGLTAVLYGGRAEAELRAEEGVELGCLTTQCLLEAHAGYNLREVLFLAASQEHMLYLEKGGARIVGDTKGGPPYLTSITRDDVEHARGGILGLLFQYRRPMLFLSEAQRELVLSALAGNSDESFARHAGLSFAAVKKRWAAVFDVTSIYLPNLLPETMRNGVRGPEKRQALLEYLRQHPEELRPQIR